MENSWTHVVEWGECDPAGIVFYPNFYRWFDASCLQLMEDYGFGQRDMISKYGIVGFPLVEAYAEFIKPVRWGEEVAVDSQIEEVSDKTFTVRHSVYKLDPREKLCASGYELRIWGKKDKTTGVMKAWKLPSEFTECF